MTESAQEHLEPGEQIQSIFGGQTVNQWWVLLTVFILLFTNDYRVVIVTDRRILVGSSGRWAATKVKRIVHELPRSTQIGPPSGFWYKCESLGDTLYIHKRFHKDVELADSLRG